jgi:hypothetical protein
MDIPPDRQSPLSVGSPRPGKTVVLPPPILSRAYWTVLGLGVASLVAAFALAVLGPRLWPVAHAPRAMPDALHPARP